MAHVSLAALAPTRRTAAPARLSAGWSRLVRNWNALTSCRGGLGQTLGMPESEQGRGEPGRDLPVIASIPHGSDFIPDEFLPDLVSPDRLWVDAFTPELYAFLARAGVSVVEAEYSQFVANPNRRPQSPKFAPFWEGIVASTNSDGDALYSEPPSSEQIDERIRRAYDTYHAAIDAAVAECLRRFERVVLLDLHSFAMDLETDVVIGDGNGTTSSPEPVIQMEQALEAQGLTVRRNLRFSGGWIVRRFAGHPRVDAIQIELNQRCYAEPAAIDARALPLPYEADRIAETTLRLQRAFGPLLNGRTPEPEG